MSQLIDGAAAVVDSRSFVLKIFKNPKGPISRLFIILVIVLLLLLFEVLL